MHLKKLTLLNFKNCSDVVLDFSENVICFLGNNGQGKTNILDAIFYLSYTKSYFSSIDSHNIQFGLPFFVISGEFSLQDEIVSLNCAVKLGKKKIFRKNKQIYTKLAEHIGEFPVVMITPYDINLILEGSEIRRKFIDSLISQFNRKYLDCLIDYNKLLQQRNIILKKWSDTGVNQESLLDVIDFQLISKGEYIYKTRNSFLIDFIPEFSFYYKNIAQSEEDVELIYQSALSNNNFKDILKTNLQKDIKLRYTSEGIHRDDLLFKIHKYPLKKYGSQGQQKSFLIALKLAKLNFIKKKKEYYPILLLDDIFDKLDDNRVSYLINLIKDDKLGQVFITETSLSRIPDILSKLKIKHQAFEINEGKSIDI